MAHPQPCWSQRLTPTSNEGKAHCTLRKIRSIAIVTGRSSAPAFASEALLRSACPPSARPRAGKEFSFALEVPKTGAGLLAARPRPPARWLSHKGSVVDVSHALSFWDSYATRRNRI
jgi:hypothetical protein